METTILHGGHKAIIKGVVGSLCADDSAKVELKTCNAGKEILIFKSRYNTETQLQQVEVTLKWNGENKLCALWTYNHNNNKEDYIFY